MKVKKHISETAFLINDARASMVNLSKDIYAYLWVNSKTKKLHNEYMEKAYPCLDLESCLRNRFFLENIKDFIQQHHNCVFVNLACGFTNYPFLVDHAKYIETDLKHVIEFKKSKMAKWQKEGKLPKRKIDFYAVDFNNEKDLEKLEKLLLFKLKNKLSFILLEGITYYLKTKISKRIFNICRRAQSKNSLLALNCGNSALRSHPLYSNFKNFLNKKHGYKTDITTLGINSVESIGGYAVKRLTNIPKLEKVYTGKSTLNFKKIFPEYYIVLEKI
jgi:O-methyltransferase involved in polyketide biosynthesis